MHVHQPELMLRIFLKLQIVVQRRPLSIEAGHQGLNGGRLY